MFVAVADSKIVGIIESRDIDSIGHIAMVFVDGAYHRKGIATAMMEHMVCELKLRGYDKITINSSPYGLPFYLHFGFVPTDVEQHKDGFIFTPMEYIPNEIWDVLDENRNKTGCLHERGKQMQKGEYHLVVHVWVVNDKNEFLISKRTPNKSDPNMWECTGGSAIAGDDSLTTAIKGDRIKVSVNGNNHQ